MTFKAKKVIKRYDKPKTPYQRVLESKYVSASVKRILKEQMKGLNPFRLRHSIERKLKRIFRLNNNKNALYV